MEGEKCESEPQCGSETRPMTFGEKAVGLKFNPGGNEKVDDVKKLFAEIIDSIERETSGSASSEMKRKLKSDAISFAIVAQMSAVKLITWKD